MEDAEEGTVELTADALDEGDILLEVTKDQANSTATYAITADATEPAAATFVALGDIATLANDNYIWIKSVSQDTTTTLYYKIKVTETL